MAEPRRGRLKGGANTEAEAEKLSLSEFNLLIAGAAWRFDSVTNSNLRKNAFKRLVWLETQRERLHGIEAPERKLAARQSGD
ncbi:hypothetical protein DW352_22395 [Pseudolabrys taiwanensis]|uniref:Uncharacterized protein n=1 Tax=Pseudolabrys taiwanensis TaxID=331696 RepID=A0A346A1I1_9HYPH|nr:hypothetical protein [Pseudolabrys taiwanensis]AXK83028.1 hypothetical protein DW352_22395 [Pseudolabrys taiwanensis]